MAFFGALVEHPVAVDPGHLGPQWPSDPTNLQPPSISQPQRDRLRAFAPVAPSGGGAGLRPGHRPWSWGWWQLCADAETCRWPAGRLSGLEKGWDV